jgi:hypothetical protein
MPARIAILEKLLMASKSFTSLDFMSHPLVTNPTKGVYEKIQRGKIRLHGDARLRRLWFILA